MIRAILKKRSHLLIFNRGVAGGGRFLPPMVRTPLLPPMVRTPFLPPIPFKHTPMIQLRYAIRPNHTWSEAIKLSLNDAIRISLESLCTNERFGAWFLSFVTHSEKLKYKLFSSQSSRAEKSQDFTVKSACSTFADVFTEPLLTLIIFIGVQLLALAKVWSDKDGSLKMTKVNSLEEEIAGLREIAMESEEERVSLRKLLEASEANQKEEIEKMKLSHQQDLEQLRIKQEEETKKIWEELETKSTKWW